MDFLQAQELAQELDHKDPLRTFRDEFLLPDGTIYLDGNSLGALSRSSSKAVESALHHQWGQDLIVSWNKADWIHLGQRCARLLEPLIGAEANSVGVGDSISVNLFKVASAALALNPKRSIIISEAENFPSDLYVLDGVARTSGKEFKALPKSEILSALNTDVALLELSHIDYRSAEIWEMKEITARAHEFGIPVIWDLAHSAGIYPVQLAECDADFAIGCTYKYLNGGPGAPGFWYIAPRHQQSMLNPIQGWFGHKKAFAFSPEYVPADGPDRFYTGTPSVLGLSSLHASLELFAKAEMANVREKSISLIDFTQELAEKHLLSRGCSIFTETNAAKRGSHISFTHPQGYAIVQALIKRKIIGDFRRPDVLRFGFAPFYNSHQDGLTLVKSIVDIIDSKEYESPEFQTESEVI